MHEKWREKYLFRRNKTDMFAIVLVYIYILIGIVCVDLDKEMTKLLRSNNKKGT